MLFMMASLSPRGTTAGIEGDVTESSFSFLKREKMIKI
jgi:hypothetical protein